MTVLSLLPPFAPILMPARMALGVAPTWQVLARDRADGRRDRRDHLARRQGLPNAVLRTGSRVKLRDALAVLIRSAVD